MGLSKNGRFQIPVGHHVVHSWSSNGHIPHFQTHPCGPPPPSRPSSVFSCPRLLDKDIALSRLVHSKIIVQVDDLKEWFGRRFPGHKMGFLFENWPTSDGNVLESPNFQTNPRRRWKLNESAHPGVGKMQGWPKEASWLIDSLRYHPFKWWSIHSYSQNPGIISSSCWDLFPDHGWYHTRNHPQLTLERNSPPMEQQHLKKRCRRKKPTA